jgi:DNA-directed RNA polymerase specialized sigma24 family protein
MLSMMDLESLLRAARNREPGAWDAMAPRLGPKLHWFFTREFGDLDPFELTQRTMVILASDLPKAVIRKSLEKWVFGVARNQGRREHRARRKDDRLQALVAVVACPIGTSPSAGAYLNELIAVVREEIEKLPLKYRLVVESDLEGNGIATYAKKAEIDPNTARVHRFRAREILRKRLAERLQLAPLAAPVREESTPDTPA